MKLLLTTTHVRFLGEKPYRCLHPSCLKRFRYKGDLSKHIKRYHPEHIQDLVPVALQEDEIRTLQASGVVHTEIVVNNTTTSSSLTSQPSITLVKSMGGSTVNLERSPSMTLGTTSSTTRSGMTSASTGSASVETTSVGGGPSSCNSVVQNNDHNQFFFNMLPNEPVEKSELPKTASGQHGDIVMFDLMATEQKPLHVTTQQQQQQPQQLSLGDNLLKLFSPDEPSSIPTTSSVSVVKCQEQSSAEFGCQINPPSIVFCSTAAATGNVKSANTTTASASCSGLQTGTNSILHDVLTRGTTKSELAKQAEKTIMSSASKIGTAASVTVATAQPTATNSFVVPSSAFLKTTATTIGGSTAAPPKTIFTSSTITSPVVATAARSGVALANSAGQTLNIQSVLAGSQPVRSMMVPQLQHHQQQIQPQQLQRAPLNSSVATTQIITTATTTIGTKVQKLDLSATALLPSRPTKPFPCDVPGCNRSFEKQNLLRRHSKLHSANCKYVCEVCKKSFESKSKLDDHSRKHTGEKPFNCNLCGNSFRYKGNKRILCQIFHNSISAMQAIDFFSLHGTNRIQL